MPTRKSIKNVSLALSSCLLLMAGGQTLAQESPEDLEKVIMDRLSDVREEQEKNSLVPKIEKPPSLCVGDAMKKTENFFNTLIPDVCDMIDADPDVEGSRYRYENPDGGCDIGLRMPGLPDIGFSYDGFDACALVKAVTSDMVDMANRKMREEFNSAMDSVKDATGLKDFNLDVSANDVVTGDEDFRD